MEYESDVRLPNLKRKNSTSSDESDSELEYRSKRTITPEPKTLAIGIFTHGEILSDVVGDPIENTTFPNVYIVKHNVGGFGCVTVKILKSDFINYTKHAYNHIETCINPQKYIDVSTAIVNKSTKPKTLKHKSLFSTSGVCQIFRGSTRFYEKSYVGDPLQPSFNVITFGMMKHGIFDCINILTCSTISLYSFITSDLPNSHEDTYDSATDSLYDDDFSDDIYKLCKTFTSNRKSVTTTNLFTFVETLKQTQHINKVHILDMSCNVIKAGFCDTEDKVCNGYKLNPSGMAPSEIAFGGKTRKTKSKRKRKSKRKFI